MSAHPELFRPPGTDAGTLPNLRFSFAEAHNRREHGGWAREVTRRELPVATELAGVDMRLAPGAVRELHWHKQAEWAYLLWGRARISAVDPDGRRFADDVGEGDLWYFPAGVPHAIQGLDEGCEFLLVFDDGGFSENSTFLLSDWLAHTPTDVLARNLGVDADELDALPPEELYIFPAPLPTAPARRDAGAPRFSHRLLRRTPIATPGGRVWIADSASFPAATTIAAALVEVDPGGLRELHWHPHADEWQYYVAGCARMTVFAASGTARTFDYRAGDVGYVPRAMGHYVENAGEGPLRFLELFRSDRYAEVSLNRWLAQTPGELVRAHLGLDPGDLTRVSAEHRPVRPPTPKESP
jgi:oxalate decarboxylase